MAKRPESHLLEERSRHRFRGALPMGWIVRSQSPDYGLDEHVQIVEGELVTPLLFAVQLKATGRLNKKKTFSLSTERLRDYAGLHLPVMIAVHDAVTDALYFSWAHLLHQRLTRAEAAAWLVKEQVAIAMDEEFTADSSRRIANEVKDFYARLRHDGQGSPVPIAFECEKESFMPQTLLSALGTTAYAIVVVPKVEATLIVGFAGLAVKLCGEGFEFVLEANSSDLLLPTALTALVLGFAAVKRTQLSLDCLGKLVERYKPLPDEIGQALRSSPLLPIAYGGDLRTGDALTVAEMLLEAGDVNTGLFLASSFLYDKRRLDTHTSKSGRLLKQALLASIPGDQRATILYSLGNHYRSQGEHREALSRYFSACKESRGYLNHDYWWSEAAGCLFLLHKYRFAELFYRKALACGSHGPKNETARMLLADALLRQGQYAAATSELETYFKAVDNNPMAYAVLLHALASTLTAAALSGPRRSEEAAHVLAGALPPLEEPVWLAKALAADPLCALAHFDLGICLHKSGEQKRAAWHFTLAAFLQASDIEAWCNACVLFIGLTAGEGEPGLATAVFAEAYRLHGPLLEQEFLKRLATDGIKSVKANESAKQLVALARKCEAMYAQPNAAYFRMPNLQDDSIAVQGFWLSKATVPNIL